MANGPSERPRMLGGGAPDDEEREDESSPETTADGDSLVAPSGSQGPPPASDTGGQDGRPAPPPDPTAPGDARSPGGPAPPADSTTPGPDVTQTQTDTGTGGGGPDIQGGAPPETMVGQDPTAPRAGETRPPTGRAPEVTRLGSERPTGGTDRQQFSQFQGAEVTGSGFIQDRAQEIEQQTIEQNEQISEPWQVAVERSARGGWDVHLTEAGAEDVAELQLEEEFGRDFTRDDFDLLPGGDIELTESGQEIAQASQMVDLFGEGQRPSVFNILDEQRDVPILPGSDATGGGGPPASSVGGIPGDEPGKEITGQFEQQFEEETGADLEPGEDFVIRGDLQSGFRARLTDEGREAVREAQKEPKSINVPLIGSEGLDVLAPAGGGRGVITIPGEIGLGKKQDLGEAEDITVGLPGLRPIAVNRIPETVVALGGAEFDVPEEVMGVPFGGAQLEEFGTAAQRGTIETFDDLATEFEEATAPAEESRIAPQGAVTANPFLVGGEQASAARELTAASIRGTGQLASAPFGIASSAEEATETSIAVAEGGATVGEVAGQAGIVGAEAGEAVKEDPLQAGVTLGLSAVLFGGTAALSPRLGSATRFAIQPGEEIASAGLTRAAPGVAKRFPNNRIDNEEIILQAGARGLSRAGQGARRAARGVRARTPEVGVEFDPDRPLFDVNVDRPRLPPSSFELEVPGQRLDIGNPFGRGLPEVPDRPSVRGSVGEGRAQVAGLLQSAAIEQERLGRQVRAGVDDRLTTLGELPGRAAELPGQARTRALRFGQGRALEAEAALFNIRQRAAQADVRNRFTELLSPDVSPFVSSIRAAPARARLRGEAAAASLRERSFRPDIDVSRPDIGVGSLFGELGDAAARTELEARAARAELAEGEIPSIFPQPDVPSPEVPPVGDLTIRIGESGTGDPTPFGIDADRVPRTPLDLEVPRSEPDTDDDLIPGATFESDVDVGEGQVARIRTGARGEVEQVGVGREFDLEGNRLFGSGAEIVEPPTGGVGVSPTDLGGAFLGEGVSDIPGEATEPEFDPFEIPGEDVFQRVSGEGMLETGREQGLETELEAESEQEFETEFEQELKLELEQEFDQEFEFEFEFESESEAEFEFPNPFDMGQGDRGLGPGPAPAGERFQNPIASGAEFLFGGFSSGGSQAGGGLFGFADAGTSAGGGVEEVTDPAEARFDEELFGGGIFGMGEAGKDAGGIFGFGGSDEAGSIFDPADNDLDAGPFGPLGGE